MLTAGMNKIGRIASGTLATLTAFCVDDNDDGNQTHLGTEVISHASVHDSANEDLGTYEQPGTLAGGRRLPKPRDQSLRVRAETLLRDGRYMS
jgi:hypothetical protein